MRELTVHIVMLAWTTLAWGLGGSRVLPSLLRRQDPALVAATSLLLGAGGTAFLLTVAALFGALNFGVVLAVQIGWSILALQAARGLWTQGCLGKMAIPRWSPSQVALGGLLALTAVLTLVATLAPPTSMDATVYHLRIPREFLRVGRIVPLADDVHASQPLYVEMLFASAMSLNDDVLAALTHWLLGVAASLAAVAWGRSLGARRTLPVAALFAVVPLVVWESTSSFIDLGLAAFTALGLLWATRSDLGVPALATATIFAGLAAGSKYTGCFSALMIGATAAAAGWPDRKAAIHRFVVVGFGAVLLASPWYIRNVLFTRNPFHPLGNSWFGLPAQKLAGVTYGLGYDVLHLLSSPFDLIWRGDAFDSGWAIGPAYLALAPIAFLAPTRTRLKITAALLIAGYWLFWFWSSPQGRLLLPILPIAAGLAAVGLEAALVSGFWPRTAASVVLVASLGVGVGTALVAARSSLPVVVGAEERSTFLRRLSWDYTAFEETNRLLDSTARLAVFGAQNVYYVDAPATMVDHNDPQRLLQAGFSHLLDIGPCPRMPSQHDKETLWAGKYPRRGSRFQGVTPDSEACARLSKLSP